MPDFADLQQRLPVALALILVTLLALLWGDWPFALYVALVAGLALREWWRLRPDWPGRLWGIAYLGLFSLAALWLRGLADGVWWLVLLLGTVWATDSGAYFAGRAIGGPKLWPGISPKKTWAGLVGGLGAALLWAGLLAGLLGLAVAPVVGLCLLLGLVSQAGDLFESWLKRQAGRKDSGGLLPGHGGILDRIDALLPATIALAVLLLCDSVL